MKLILFFMLWLLVAANEYTDWQTDYDTALHIAQQQNKHVLMVFAGSDWCKPCIRFKESILLSEAFAEYKKEHLIILYLDFPAKKKNKLNTEQLMHNEQLAEQYNKSGAFPKIILLDNMGTKIKEIAFRNQSPDIFIREIGIQQNSNVSLLAPEPIVTHSKTVQLMGCRFVLTAAAQNDTIAWQAIHAGIGEIQRIEKLISSWDSTSQTSAINDNAGIRPVEVDKELFDLIVRSIKVSELTEGAFDISFAAMARLYTFDGGEHSLPNMHIINNAKAAVNWQNIILDHEAQTVFLKETGMRISFGAIGKGYAANRAKAVMEKMNGIHSGIVNASGDILVWGQEKTIYIADPKNTDNALASLNVENTAIVTSGDYERFFTCKGKRYAHIINPKNGLPVTGIKSVTIICPDAELADALATAVFVMGKEKGLYLVNQLNYVEGIIVDRKDEIFTSENIELNYH